MKTEDRNDERKVSLIFPRPIPPQTIDMKKPVTEAEFMQKLSAERAGYQAMLGKMTKETS